MIFTLPTKKFYFAIFKAKYGVATYIKSQSPKKAEGRES